MVLNRVDKISRIREEIRQNLKIGYERASKTYNLRTRPTRFQKGQMVFRRNFALSNLAKGINAKFMKKFLKCRIKNRIGNCLYDIEDLKGKYIGRYHASDIKA